MEVGAVKQAFNNEVILLKKKLNQAKIQIIHKLTRKAKQLTEKKAPEQLKEKLNRKAESAVKEVLIIKKIKAKDIAKFIVTHQGELNSFLNKPLVDQDKACARLLLHKALQDKYKFIRDRFSNVPIQDLFMSRLERRKMKKEAKEKQKNKKKGKDNKVVNSEGDWNVEDVDMGDKSKACDDDDDDDDDDFSDDEGNDNELPSDGDESVDENDESGAENESNDDLEENNVQEHYDSELSVEESDSEVKQEVKNKKLNIKPKLETHNVKPKTEIGQAEATDSIKLNPPKELVKKKLEKKNKDSNKHKNLNEKILQRKFKKGSDAPAVENKIVDPFFITSTGENYLSVVEPRAPDEIKEVHKQGNRKLRRAVMFGHIPKSRLRQNNNYNNDNENRFNKQNKFDRSNNFRDKFNDGPQFNDKNNFNDRKSFNNDFNGKRGFNNRDNDDKPEKLHPSWEAKKKKSGILPFEGKKIVFDES